MLQDAIEVFSGFLSSDRDGEVLLLDTNTIMHHRQLDEVTWLAEVGVKRVRLMIPLLVMDELDAKTYASSKQLAGRAEKRLRLLDRHLEQAVTGASEVRDGVTVEILADSADYHRKKLDHVCVELPEWSLNFERLRSSELGQVLGSPLTELFARPVDGRRHRALLLVLLDLPKPKYHKAVCILVYNKSVAAWFKRIGLNQVGLDQLTAVTANRPLVHDPAPEQFGDVPLHMVLVRLGAGMPESDTHICPDRLLPGTGMRWPAITARTPS